MNEPTRRALEILRRYPRGRPGSGQNLFRMNLFINLAASFGRGKWADVDMTVEEAIAEAIRTVREWRNDPTFDPKLEWSSRATS
jgi:hypothetical protein